MTTSARTYTTPRDSIQAKGQVLNPDDDRWLSAWWEDFRLCQQLLAAKGGVAA